MLRKIQNQEVLGKIQNQEVYSNPFPHIVVKDYLPAKTLELLMNDLVQYELLLRNKQEELKTKKYSLDSKKFTQADFFDKSDFKSFPAIENCFDHFASSEFHIELAKTLAPWAEGRLNISSANVIELAREKRQETSIKFGPPDIPRARSIHIDGNTTVLTYLFYLRLPNDFSTGGELCLYSREKEYDRVSKILRPLIRNRYFPWEYHLIKSVPYTANTLVAFLNCPDSYHSVSTRLGPVVNRIAFHGGINSNTGLF